MSRYNIGNMKIILGKEGFGVKVGEKKLFHFGSKSAPSGEGYADYPDDSDFAFEDQEQYYPEDEAGYDGYDGYDNPEDGGYDDGGYYDDQENGYYAEDDGYYQEDGGQERGGKLMEYIENHPWVIYAMLVVFPLCPIAIWLLWRQNRFEFPVRMGVSVASAIWFVVALILVISAAVGGGEDPSKLPEMTLTTMAPTQVPTAEPVATATIAPETSAEPSVTPGATPLGGSNVGDETGEAPSTGDSDLENVYSPQTGLYYHSVDNCSNIDAGAQVTLVTRQAAVNRNQAPCPLCCGGEVFYATKDGRWYHTDRLCKGMDGAIEYSKEAAEKEGKTPCPTCAGGDDGSDDTGTKKTKAQKYVEKITTDRSGVEVYWTAKGTWFHTVENCQSMKNAQKTTLLKAMQAGKTGCPVCFKDANKLVYCTSGGRSYHLDKNCQNMKDASQVTLAAAAVLGKSKCTICVTEEFYNEPTPAPKAEVPKGDGSTAYVYATEGGRYYHTNSACTDMKNAQKVTLLSMIKAGRPACPTCCSSASNTVYVVKNGKYYHSYATCSDMTNAQAGTLAQALAYGYKACYDCWSGSKPVDDDDDGDKKPSNNNGNDGYSDVYIYASENGKYFHTRKNCSKADSDVSKVLLELAIDDGKTACPTCASEADDTVYAKKGDKYYHKAKECQDITGMTAGTLAKALIKGYEACPVCYKNDDDDKETKKYTPGKSGINVYASGSGKYYHTVKSCTAAKGSVVKVTLEAALNNNKSACTVCAASARRTVYATKSGKYYHYSSSCAGSSATSGKLDAALATGFKACPNCVTGDKNDDDKKDKFTPGKSGIKVYAVTSGKYFHTKDTCGSMKDGTKITLEDALNYGLKACPNCAAAAAKKVYATEGAGTYHFDASCAGTKAVSGTRAEALALGLKACSKCVNNDDDGLPEPENPGEPTDPEDRSAPKDTRVYIDLSGKTNEFLYHTNAKCEGCGMTGGTAVTLKYALDQGFADCGHCKPPLSIAK